ncbi:USP2 [Cordylochernes scorpioides]|uniref:ubiquitinyl hydrolase 1 n=1 Tax=Cordylochernes scorpioides TaxID=51811 RepID=A0ABY6KYS7_9ARAC|nr:USP2 [Cordylochernes scorpioides]
MLLEDMWKQDGPLKPKEFHEYVGSLDSRFGNYTEEDSMEYLQFLICQLRNELNSPTESEAKTETTDKGLQSWQEYVQIENSPLVHIFASQVFKAIRCQSCPYTSERYEVYWDFSFPIPEKPNPTIHDCFTQLFEREVIEDYTCGKCNQKGCVKTFNISKWPKILKIQFFRFSAFDQQKINNMIHFPINLDLSQFGSTTKYDLYAVVNHFGNRDSGHYLADAKHPISGKWYRYDDKRVKGIESTQVLKEVYDEKCMNIKNVRKWCREFNEGRINVHDEQRSGRPSLPESTVARIDEMVRANRRITLEEIEDVLNEDCSHFSVHKIVSETLSYRKVSARWVDKWLKEAAGEWYNTGITKLGDRMKKVIEHQADYVEK